MRFHSWHETFRFISTSWKNKEICMRYHQPFYNSVSNWQKKCIKFISVKTRGYHPVKICSWHSRDCCSGTFDITLTAANQDLLNVELYSINQLANFLSCSMYQNSSLPGYAIRRHRSGPTLAQVMACCLTGPSHYLNRCWLPINNIHFMRYTPATNDQNKF